MQLIKLLSIQSASFYSRLVILKNLNGMVRIRIFISGLHVILTSCTRSVFQKNPRLKEQMNFLRSTKNSYSAKSSLKNSAKGFIFQFTTISAR